MKNQIKVSIAAMVLSLTANAGLPEIAQLQKSIGEQLSNYGAMVPQSIPSQCANFSGKWKKTCKTTPENFLSNVDIPEIETESVIQQHACNLYIVDGRSFGIGLIKSESQNYELASENIFNMHIVSIVNWTADNRDLEFHSLGMWRTTKGNTVSFDFKSVLTKVDENNIRESGTVKSTMINADMVCDYSRL